GAVGWVFQGFIRGPSGAPARSAGVAGMALPPLIVAAHGVLQSADCILHLAGGLFAFAFRFGLGVAGYLSDFLFQGAVGLFGCALHAIFVHAVLPFVAVPGQRHRIGLRSALVWRFRSPHHSCSESEMRTSEPKPY